MNQTSNLNKSNLELIRYFVINYIFVQIFLNIQISNQISLRTPTEEMSDIH